ncbi:MAG TPA: hypothetical protein VG537_08395 [Candidatus Kapabacteria bacterium]|jgi:hypothetical protein|nr:hypothetical protein [Candidatus Kapabacteria bacterium]
MKTIPIILFILTSITFGSCDWQPPNGGPARGSAHISYDSSSYDVAGVYFGGGDTSANNSNGEFNLRTNFGIYPSASYHSVYFQVLKFDHTGAYSFDTTMNVYLSLLADVPPFYSRSDSGQVTFVRVTYDTVIGTLSVRLRGDDSSMHHLTMTFVASSPFPMD